MAERKGHLQIDLLGASFAIKADEQDEYLQNIYAHYRKVVADVEKNSGVTDALRIAIIAGVLLADELAKERLNPQMSFDYTTNMPIIERSVKRMVDSIDSAIASVFSVK